MSYPRHEQAKVVLEHERYDTAYHLKPLLRLDEAERNLASVEGDLGTAALQPYRDALEAAEADVEELFREELTIKQAETLHHRLGAAIVQAKIWRGDFTYYREGDDE